MARVQGILIVFLLVCFAGAAAADVRMPAIMSDNMMLQQSADVTIWGWADAGEEVMVIPGWDKDSKGNSTVAGSDGKWKVSIKTPQAGGPYSITIKGRNTVEIKNVLTGEVWLCSGQSNMEMPMNGWVKQPIMGGEEDLKKASNKNIRLFTVPKRICSEVQEDVNGKWVECSPETAREFSAVGYYFAREINAKAGMPVGMIFSAYGGTAAEAWTRGEFIENDCELACINERYEKRLEEWQKQVQTAKLKNEQEPNRPKEIRELDRCSCLYNGMIAPLTNMKIKGVIWYQGETNTSRAAEYRKLFPKLIENWRCDFENPEMPFYFVQLASFTKHTPGKKVEIYSGEPRECPWAELREAQLMTSRLKNTGMAVAIDIGQANCIHPGNKKDVGERLARWALAKDYGKDVECSGPMYYGYKIEGDKIRVKFNYAEGLYAKGGEVKAFAIAGKDKKFAWAKARIEGNSVVVWHEGIVKPAAVRYGWELYPECNLFNRHGLPASPFTTE